MPIIISKELREQIDGEALRFFSGQAGYKAAGVKYGSAWEDAERRFKEAMQLLDPILEYGQSKEANIQLGKSVTAMILQRIKQFEQAKKALEDIASGKVLPQLIAQQTLASWKEEGLKDKTALRQIGTMTTDEWQQNRNNFSPDLCGAIEHCYIKWADKPKHVLVLENRLQTNTLLYNDGMLLMRMGFDLSKTEHTKTS